MMRPIKLNNPLEPLMFRIKSQPSPDQHFTPVFEGLIHLTDADTLTSFNFVLEREGPYILEVCYTGSNTWLELGTLQTEEDLREMYRAQSDEFCRECRGPYPSDKWPGNQYSGHWDTCPNRVQDPNWRKDDTKHA